MRQALVYVPWVQAAFAALLLAAPIDSASGTVAAVERVPEASTGQVHRLRLTIKDKSSEARLVQWLGQKALIEEDMRAAEQLRAAKRHELAAYDAEWRDRFGLGPEARYEYDAKTRTVYEVASGTETGATGRVERRIACKLETDEQLKTFARLIAVRLAAREQLEAFDAVLARKRTELNRAEDALQREFSLQPGREYGYDLRTMSVYDVDGAQAP